MDGGLRTEQPAGRGKAEEDPPPGGVFTHWEPWLVSHSLLRRLLPFVVKVPKGQKVPENASHELQLKLGSVVRAQRKRLGVTQEELAWRAEMHRTYLADIERGARNITLKSIANLARGLEVSVATLLEHPEMSKAPGAANAGPGEILLVEDEAADAELTLRAFRRARIANPVKVVRDGREALEYLRCTGRYARRRPVAPELVLLDLNLPGMSGSELLRQIKAERATRHVPVVVLSGVRHDRSVIECGRLGAANYIIKPVGFEHLARIAPKLNLYWSLGRSHRAPARRSRS